MEDPGFKEAPKAQAASACNSRQTAVGEESIAIIGAANRLPGQIATPEQLWQHLASDREAISEVPKERWPIDEYYDPVPATPGKVYSKYGGFVDSAESFDAELFGISPPEARAMDPQQRLLLETAWEAIERAGYAPNALVGTNTGVFVGISKREYSDIADIASQPELIGPHTLTGNLFSIAAGRISHILGLRGPNLAVDTACSSSLVAIHFATQSLRNGECKMALAGGVHLSLRAEHSVGLCQMRALSPDGRCHTFDARANGFVSSEGSGFIVLKRLGDALADGDSILGIVRGSATNHDGRSSSLTAPKRCITRSVDSNLADIGMSQGDGCVFHRNAWYRHDAG